jgi:superfamily II DNA or RNA helicase/DNA modification methylase
VIDGSDSTRGVGRRIDVRNDYRAFLAAKVIPGVRYEGDEAILPTWDFVSTDLRNTITDCAPHLHEYQRFAVAFAVARHRAALFLECGLGKTHIGLAWLAACLCAGESGVVSAPMAALHEWEAVRAEFFPFLDVHMFETADLDAWLKAPRGIALVTHHAFARVRDLSRITAIIPDESSILKSGDGAIAQGLVRSARAVPRRLALTATPAPNDPTEFAAHATFLGYMRSEAEFRARFFVRDGKDWRIKGHARSALPRWLSRFALWMSDPASYGMPCAALPSEPYTIRTVELPSPESDTDLERDLFGAPRESMTMSQRATLRGEAYADRRRIDAIVREAQGKRTVVWCLRNEQADAAEKALRASGLRVAQIAGTTLDQDRVRYVRAFVAGELDALVSKAKVIGHGVNLQQTERMIYAGYDESYETRHQTIRRGHRQGRKGSLDVVYLATPAEQQILATLNAKGCEWLENTSRQEAEFRRALSGDLAAYHSGAPMQVESESRHVHPPVETEFYRLIHGDSILHMAETLESDSVDLAVFSPPFSSLFTYSSEAADMGNCSDQDTVEFNIHFEHFCRSLYRVMKPGRVVCLHLSQLIAFRARHGRKGLRDFRSDVIRVMENCFRGEDGRTSGFYYYGEWVIPKNPQAVAIRTKTERLQFSQFKRDSLESSPALNDYVLEFRKPGAQAVPVKNDVTNEEWIKWASGVWEDIRESDVLSHRAARGDADEKHIAPLQLTVIRRCIRLYSNPGETVLTPFLGVGSEAYEAIKAGFEGKSAPRFAVGIELKEEYYLQAVANAERAVSEALGQFRLFDALPGDLALDNMHNIG